MILSFMNFSPSEPLFKENHSVFITAKWPNETSASATEGNIEKHSQHNKTTQSETDLSAEEIASKYDIDSKLSIISLKRLDKDGNVLDDNNNIIAKEDLFTNEEGIIINADGEIIGAVKKTTFYWAAILIFGGGLILNLMPCVFPVLGVKVLGFVQLAGNDPKKIKMHGIVFSLGVIVSMWILAAVILIIRDSTGEGVAWGNQMQNPIFVGCMIILMAMFALNLYGVFEVGTSLTSAGGSLHAKKGYEGSFFSGVLTTLIATPCGAPLLATAMTYTLQQTIFLALILFTIFGLGVAAPYLILSFFPALNGIILMLWALVILASAGFIYGTWGTPMISKGKRYLLGYGLASLFAIWGGYLGYQSMITEPAEDTQTQTIVSNSDDIHSWANWTPGIVDHHRSKKRIVWIDYTADW